MAELLIKRAAHWMDSLTEDDVRKLSPVLQRTYRRRKQVGDVVVVMPDGHKWGRRECWPRYIVVKVPDMTVREARRYVEREMTAEWDNIQGKTVYRNTKTRRYSFDPALVKSITDPRPPTMTKADVQSRITEKSVLSHG